MPRAKTSTSVTNLARDQVRLLMQLGFSKKQILRYLFDEHNTPIARLSVNNLVTEATKRDAGYTVSPSELLSILKPFLPQLIKNLPYPENAIKNFEMYNKERRRAMTEQSSQEDEAAYRLFVIGQEAKKREQTGERTAHA